MLDRRGTRRHDTACMSPPPPPVPPSPCPWQPAGTDLRAAAQAKGWDPPTLARRLDRVLDRPVSVPALEAILRGRLRPQPALVAALAEVLELSAADLYDLFDYPLPVTPPRKAAGHGVRC